MAIISGPSFVWRSIFRAKLVLRHGARWKLGSGYNISILGEPWLSDGTSFPLVNLTHLVALQGYSVGHLIHQGVKSSNEELVRHVFKEGTTQHIW